MTAPTPKRTLKGGELMTLVKAANTAQVSESTIKRIIQLGYLESVKIGGTRFVYYRDLLRGFWQYESEKARPGRKAANSKWSD